MCLAIYLWVVMLQLATTFGDSKFERTYLAPDNQSVVEYNGSMLVVESRLCKNLGFRTLLQLSLIRLYAERPRRNFSYH
jgi:hypothetical protein